MVDTTLLSRSSIENAIEALLALLDQLDGDCATSKALGTTSQPLQALIPTALVMIENWMKAIWNCQAMNMISA